MVGGETLSSESFPAKKTLGRSKTRQNLILAINFAPAVCSSVCFSSGTRVIGHPPHWCQIPRTTSFTPGLPFSIGTWESANPTLGDVCPHRLGNHICTVICSFARFRHRILRGSASFCQSKSNVDDLPYDRICLTSRPGLVTIVELSVTDIGPSVGQLPTEHPTTTRPTRNNAFSSGTQKHRTSHQYRYSYPRWQYQFCSYTPRGSSHRRSLQNSVRRNGLVRTSGGQRRCLCRI